MKKDTKDKEITGKTLDKMKKKEVKRNKTPIISTTFLTKVIKITTSRIFDRFALYFNNYTIS